VTGYSQTVGNVYAINTTNNNDYTIINTGFKSPYGLAVTPDGKNVYVANSGNNNVSVINTTTNTVSTISGFYQPRSIGQFIGTIPI
jgi:YVTN family beta-propeller protein